MAAIDYIQDRRLKKLKYHDASWSVSGSELTMNGVVQGQIDWGKSRYLKVGNELNFFAFVSGSDSYRVLLETRRNGYVPPKDYGWRSVPVQVEEDD